MFTCLKFEPCLLTRPINCVYSAFVQGNDKIMILSQYFCKPSTPVVIGEEARITSNLCSPKSVIILSRSSELFSPVYSLKVIPSFLSSFLMFGINFLINCV